MGRTQTNGKGKRRAAVGDTKKLVQKVREVQQKRKEVLDAQRAAKDAENEFMAQVMSMKDEEGTTFLHCGSRASRVRRGDEALRKHGQNALWYSDVPLRPCVVHVDGKKYKLLGTSFNVAQLLIAVEQGDIPPQRTLKSTKCKNKVMAWDDKVQHHTSYITVNTNEPAFVRSRCFEYEGPDGKVLSAEPCYGCKNPLCTHFQVNCMLDNDPEYTPTSPEYIPTSPAYSPTSPAHS